MGRMGEVALDVRQQVEAAVMTQAERLGPTGLNKAAIVAQFRGRAPTATLYRWIGAAIKSGRPGQHVARVVQAAAADRAARSVAPAAEVAAEAAAMMPVIVGVEDVIVAPTGGVLDAIAEIGQCIAAARQVLDYSRTPAGAVRVPKMMLAAAETMRRAVATAVELQKSLFDAAQTERFQNEIVGVIRDVATAHPAAAELLLRRIEGVTTRWS